MGLFFVAIVLFMPKGLAGGVDQLMKRFSSSTNGEPVKRKTGIEEGSQ